MKIAANLWVYQPCAGGREETGACLELAGKTRFKYADMGFYDFEDSVVNKPGWRQWAETIKETAEKNGVKAIQAHSSDSVYDIGEKRDKTVESIKKQIEICGIIGIPQIIVHSVLKPGNTWKQFRSQNKDFYNLFIETAEKHNVTILLENGCYQNSRGMYYYTTAELLLTTINDLGCHPLTGICWDTGHAHMQGSDQYAEILEMGGWLKGLHIHDNWGDRDTHSMPFTGSCGFDAVVKGLVDVKYGGYFTLEDCAVTPADFSRRRGYNAKNGDEKLTDLPVEIIIQSENLNYEIAKHMLTQYGCFEE